MMKNIMTNNNNEYDPNWCYYSGMPSPMAYMNNNNITHMKGPQEHKTFKDIRGSYTPIGTNELGIQWDQCSISVHLHKGTFRGLHYQTNPPQTKYVKVVQGSILDFLYNLDTGEVDYWAVGDNQAILIPDNMAHGFLTLEDNTIVAYMVKGEYNPDSEHSIVWTEVDSVREVIETMLNGMDVDITISDKDKLGK